MKTKTVQIRYIDQTTGLIVMNRVAALVPRVGDEIRIGDTTFFEVRRLVWVYDEPECPYDRVNIGVRKLQVVNV